MAVLATDGPTYCSSAALVVGQWECFRLHHLVLAAAAMAELELDEVVQGLVVEGLVKVV